MANTQKRVLVTGATGGLGTAMCKKLAEDGYTIAANYRSRDKAEAWKQKMASENIEVHLFEGDVTDYDSVGRMIAAIEAGLGPVDVLVNNAGITRDGRFAKMSLEDWKAVMATNLDSVFNCTRQVINGMIDRKYGRIINILR